MRLTRLVKDPFLYRYCTAPRVIKPFVLEPDRTMVLGNISEGILVLGNLLNLTDSHLRKFKDISKCTYMFKVADKMTYCGNNRLELVSGGKVLGTPYQCLRKGVGVGLHAPTSGTARYEPIDPPTPTFCGTPPPPAGKVMGSRVACFRKGFGVGQRLKATRISGYKGLLTVRNVFLLVCLLIVTFIVLSFLLFSIKVALIILGVSTLLLAGTYLILKLLGYVTFKG